MKDRLGKKENLSLDEINDYLRDPTNGLIKQLDDLIEQAWGDIEGRSLHDFFKEVKNKRYEIPNY